MRRPHVEAEVHAPVGGVEPDAAIGRFARLGHQLAVGVEHAAGVGGEVVGEDVAVVQQRQQFADDGGVIALLGIANVDHQPGAAFARCAACQAGHLHAEDLQRRRHHAGLDAVDQAAVLGHRLKGAFEVDAAFRHDVGHGGQAGLADVQEGNDLGMALRHDVAGKGAEGGAPRAAGVDDRGDARMHPAEVGMHAIADDAVEDVGVQVDEARRDRAPGYVDDPRRLVACDEGCNVGNLAVLNGDVVPSAQPDGRVDHRASCQQQIVHVVPPCFGARRRDS